MVQDPEKVNENFGAGPEVDVRIPSDISLDDEKEMVATTVLSDVLPLSSQDENEDEPIGLLQYFGVGTSKSNKDLDAVATQSSVFDNPETASAYYPREDYEGTRAFDVNFRWTWREELVSLSPLGRTPILMSR
jgi:hypothetical protein